MKLQAREDRRLPHGWDQCLSRRKILGGPPASLSDPRDSSICLTFDSELPVQPICIQDSKTSLSTNQISISGIRAVPSGGGPRDLRTFTHGWMTQLRSQAVCGLRVLSRLRGVGSGSQPADSTSYPCSTLPGACWDQPCQGLGSRRHNPEPFPLGRISWVLKVFFFPPPPLSSFSWEKYTWEGGRVEVREFFLPPIVINRDAEPCE